MKEAIWENIEKVREKSPLVHNITNFVAMNNTANALLASGASPVMAHAVEEVADMVGIAGALVVNIGTLSPRWVEGMKVALQKAKELGRPVVFDPVGAGATPYRNQVISELLQINPPSIIRGNASEIMAMMAKDKVTKGVDSTDQSGAALQSAHYLHENFGSVVCVSGEIDLVVAKNSVTKIANGHAMMAKVTGMGCTATALIGAFAAVNNDHFMATVSAMALLGVAGQMASTTSSGPGSLQVNLLDRLYNISETEFMANVNVS